MGNIKLFIICLFFTYMLVPVVAAGVRNPVKIHITTIPSGADLFIDSISKGKTPHTDFVLPGRHTLKLVLADYKTVEQTFYVLEEEPKILNIDLTRVVSVWLIVSPYDALVLANDQTLGGSSYNKYSDPYDIGVYHLKLPMGHYDIEISHPQAEKNKTIQLTVSQDQKEIKKYILLKLRQQYLNTLEESFLKKGSSL